MVRKVWMGVGTAALAAGGCALAAGVGPARSTAAAAPPAAPTFAGTITACGPTTGSVVAVDFAGANVAPFGTPDEWGGPVALGCDTSRPAHGIDLLTDTGFTTAGDQHDGPGFVCRIGSPLFAGGAPHPTPQQDPCVNTPPSSAYWSYWLAPAGQTTWTYSPLGADGDVPTAGEVEAWTFGPTDTAGTTGQPSFTPAQVRAQETTTTTTTTTTTATTTTPSTTPTGMTPRSTTGGSTTATGPAPTPPPVTAPRVIGPARPPASTVGAGRLTAAARYLVGTRRANGLAGGTSLLADGYYESAPRFADFGLTIDGALALVAADRQTAALHRVVAFIAGARRDGSRRSINQWTGIGTPDADGGSIAKEALFAEVVGDRPRQFAGHDLITALDASLCRRRARGACAGGAGSVRFGTSTFDEALVVMAELRVGDGAHARPEIAFLEREQHRNGAWPSEIPFTGDSDVDSSAMAAMALALVPRSPSAHRAEQHGIAWIATRQRPGGGFPGAAGDSTNSAALAIQALSLDGARYAPQIARARGFLLAEQNRDGGFAIATTGARTSDVRASTQALGGLVGTSFGTLAMR